MSILKLFFIGMISSFIPLYLQDGQIKIQDFRYKETENKLKQDVEFYKQVKCLADTIYYEAASESLEGRKAVAQVVLNRTHSRMYPNTVCGVVYQPHQFSWTEERKLPKKMPVAYQSALSIAENLLLRKIKGTLANNTLWYHRNDVHPRWIDNMTPVAEIGAHIFYAKGV